jgi:hypothetical protein
MKAQLDNVERVIVENFKEQVLNKNELHGYLLGMRSFVHGTVGNTNEMYTLIQYYLNNFDTLYEFYTKKGVKH